MNQSFTLLGSRFSVRVQGSCSGFAVQCSSEVYSSFSPEHLEPARRGTTNGRTEPEHERRRENPAM